MTPKPPAILTEAELREMESPIRCGRCGGQGTQLKAHDTKPYYYDGTEPCFECKGVKMIPRDDRTRNFLLTIRHLQGELRAARVGFSGLEMFCGFDTRHVNENYGALLEMTESVREYAAHYVKIIDRALGEK